MTVGQDHKMLTGEAAGYALILEARRLSLVERISRGGVVDAFRVHEYDHMCGLLRRLATALSSAHSQQDTGSWWRPIRTALKDGTKILGWGRLNVHVRGENVSSVPCAHVLAWKGSEAAGDWWSPSLPTLESHWQNAHRPTHFMPLPLPPQEPEQ